MEKVKTIELSSPTKLKLTGPIELIKKSFEIFFEKKNFIYFIKIYLPLLPFQLFFVFQNLFIKSQSWTLNDSSLTKFDTKYPWFITAVVVVNLLFMIMSFWVELAGIKAITETVSGKTNSVKSTFNFSKKNLWNFSLLVVSVGLIELGGLILLIIPGIIFSVWYGFSKFIFVNKRLGVKESLKISKNLVQGKFRQVFGRIIVFVVFTILFQTIFSLIPFGIGPAIYQLFGALLILPYFLLYQELSG